MEFKELANIAQKTLNQRRLSRIATAGESKIVKMVATKLLM